jgi:hypothetical protein
MAVLMFSTVVHCTVHMNPGPSRQRILTNESASRITCVNRVVQSQLLKFIGADKRQKTERHKGSHMEAAHCLKIKATSFSCAHTLLVPNVWCAVFGSRTFTCKQQLIEKFLSILEKEKVLF